MANSYDNVHTVIYHDAFTNSSIYRIHISSILSVNSESFIRDLLATTCFMFKSVATFSIERIHIYILAYTFCILHL